MAIQRVGGYVFSCGICGAVGDTCSTYGEARDDENEHLAAHHNGYRTRCTKCGCPTGSPRPCVHLLGAAPTS